MACKSVIVKGLYRSKYIYVKFVSNLDIDIIYRYTYSFSHVYLVYMGLDHLAPIIQQTMMLLGVTVLMEI